MDFIIYTWICIFNNGRFVCAFFSRQLSVHTHSTFGGRKTSISLLYEAKLYIWSILYKYRVWEYNIAHSDQIKTRCNNGNGNMLWMYRTRWLWQRASMCVCSFCMHDWYDKEILSTKIFVLPRHKPPSFSLTKRYEDMILKDVSHACQVLHRNAFK